MSAKPSFLKSDAHTDLGPLNDAINALYLADEADTVAQLLEQFTPGERARQRINRMATALVHSVRGNRRRSGGLDAFLQEYDLSSQEGIVLMCLAEALLRVPDGETADKLIRDKLASGNWKGHLGGNRSLFVNASTWGLMLTGSLLGPGHEAVADPANFMGKMVARAGEPVVRSAMRQAMRIMGRQFVMGRTIEDAVKRSTRKGNREYRYSFDMLGEAALTAKDARRYFDAYASAIEHIGTSAASRGVNTFDSPGISVKLSALHPRYDLHHRDRVLAELVPMLEDLAARARQHEIGFCVDAEEASRLELSLEIIARVFQSPACAGWEGFGLALQAYQKRALPVCLWLIELARSQGRRLSVRLVKGAYWDTEIKLAQEQGLQGYPVFTRKATTDLSYLACARTLLAAPEAVYPQFATHNAHTVAAIYELGGKQEYEFQRLHGMGEELYAEVIGDGKLARPCRVYAPVGQHEDLLPYLVRRLLENGANTSFVNRIVDDSAPVAKIVEDPVKLVSSWEKKPHPAIPLPEALHSPRRNSQGINLFDARSINQLAAAIADATRAEFVGSALINGAAPDPSGRKPREVVNPANRRDRVGHWWPATGADIDAAMTAAVPAAAAWNESGGDARAKILENAADLLQKNEAMLFNLCIRESGKSIFDAHSELREAIDFLRYYAQQARLEFTSAQVLPGPTGESNTLSLTGRGVFGCISPWNFPIAIFTGQVAAALAAGNAVLAKPAEQSTLAAFEVCGLLHRAGVPVEVLQFVPGDGRDVGVSLVNHADLAGVAFTGSTETAHVINRSLADKKGMIATLIAETGGLNAMLVDSSALPEQVVLDVVESAFNSAGQRCSALRVLFLQEEIAPRVLELLEGYMDELKIGDPAMLDVDCGPVIDTDALNMLRTHQELMSREGKILHQCALPKSLAPGNYFAPLAVEIQSLDQLEREVFGPILHVIRYRNDETDAVIEQINASGYGLTLGIHSRIQSSADYIIERVRVGNVYVNRNMIGAVVGVQPFGGCGLSGTGPKAGGPHYLHRYATEKTVTINTAAVGGNTSLLSLQQSD
ncbi:MAG: bifunctional proline dehydrogenase/L-glutamate gamma-semialdehyde dehydrogenase PutA [Gammaproteobacteria bacterium]|nr:bifunctional proline dehydrogenase/L-glutamate gamma-semialdehyde dehydrogenase PutA [Gammaproteobacteria bacterium]